MTAKPLDSSATFFSTFPIKSGMMPIYYITLQTSIYV